MNEKLIDDSIPITQSEYAKEIFNKWDRDIRGNYGESRFNAKNRDEILLELVEGFCFAGINYNTALEFEKKVVNTIVTKKGMKDIGKYKNWTNVVIAEYKKFLLEVYENKNLEIKVEGKQFKTNAEDSSNKPEKEYSPVNLRIEPTYGDNQHIDKNELISAWVRQKFGDYSNSQLDLLAHRAGSDLNNLFMKEVLFSEWLSTGNNVPEWAIDYI